MFDLKCVFSLEPARPVSPYTSDANSNSCRTRTRCLEVCPKSSTTPTMIAGHRTTTYPCSGSPQQSPSLTTSDPSVWPPLAAPTEPEQMSGSLDGEQSTAVVTRTSFLPLASFCYKYPHNNESKTCCQTLNIRVLFFQDGLTDSVLS